MRWSYSTQRTLERCHRQLAFAQVVAAHNARDPERREAYVLRQIQSVAAWQGSLVHAVLATQVRDALRWGRSIRPDRLTRAVRTLATRQWAFSAARQYRLPGQSKASGGAAYCALDLHERGATAGPDIIDAVAAVAQRCFTHLAQQTELLEVLRGSSRLTTEVPLTSQMAGVRVVATPDLLATHEDGGLAIVDWKVSAYEESRHSRQLGLYALLALRSGRWPALTLETLRLYEVNLWQDRIHVHTVDEEQMRDAAAYVEHGVRGLRRVLGEGTYAHLDLDGLAIAPAAETCAGCSFAGLCVRRLDAAGRVADAATVRGRVGQLTPEPFVQVHRHEQADPAEP
jgi:hypothetical protein